MTIRMLRIYYWGRADSITSAVDRDMSASLNVLTDLGQLAKQNTQSK